MEGILTWEDEGEFFRLVAPFPVGEVELCFSPHDFLIQTCMDLNLGGEEALSMILSELATPNKVGWVTCYLVNHSNGTGAFE